jgi:hypothetical protein
MGIIDEDYELFQRYIGDKVVDDEFPLASECI